MQDREVDGGGVDRADVALVPVGVLAVVGGFGDQLVEDLVAVGLPLLAPFAVHHLGVVVVGVVPVAEALVGDVVQVLLAVVQQLGDVLAVVVAGVEQAGDGRGGDGRPAAAALGTVLYAAVGHGAFADVVDGFVDDFFRHGNAGVAAAAQALHLRDGGRAFVKIAAVLGADIAPAAGRGLGLAGELDGLGQHVDQFLAAVCVFFLAQHLREEQHRIAVAVGVAVVARGIADQAVRAAAGEQIIDRQADVLGVLALRGGRAFGQQGHAGQRRHRRGIAAVVGGPVPQPRLRAGHPVEPVGHDLGRARIEFFGARPAVAAGDSQRASSRRSSTVQL